MPQYAQSVANQQTPPPYHFPDIAAKAFLIDVRMDTVQSYCDTFFNLGKAEERGFVYGPLAVFPYALLMVIRYPMMLNANRTVLGYRGLPFADRGYASQNEVFLAVPVLRRGVGGARVLLDLSVEWALPFIVVNNSTSAFSGREILGLKKLWGEIDLGTGIYPGGFSAEVRLPGWPSLDPEAVQTMMSFVTIETGTPLPSVGRRSAVASPWTALQSPLILKAFELAAQLFDGANTLANGFIPNPMRLVSLKQFRDAADPHRAIYQALVSARSRYYDVHQLQLYNEQDVSIVIHPQGSFGEIAQLFTDQTNAAIPLSVQAAFAFRANLDFDEMRTLHTFKVDDDVCVQQPNQPGAMLSPNLAPLWGLIDPQPRLSA